MIVYLLGAKTGNGHYRVLKSIESSLRKLNIRVKALPSFYEDIMESNLILSDFYNIVQMKSMKLGILLNEIMITEGEAQRTRLRGCYDQYFDTVFADDIDAIISVTPLLNRYIVDYIKNKNKKIKFYIVVTDPYKPMYPGFDIHGAEGYFLPNNTISNTFLSANIDKKKVHVVGYPVAEQFYEKNINLDSVKRRYAITSENVVIINCGNNGSTLYYNAIKSLLRLDTTNHHFIIICGKNKALYSLVKNIDEFKGHQNITLCEYVENMHELLSISEFCITKPGASTIYECLITHTIPLIVDFEGLFYQEKGIYNFLRNIINYTIQFNNFEELFSYILGEKSKKEYKYYVDMLCKLNFTKASEIIAQKIYLECGGILGDEKDIH